MAEDDLRDVLSRQVANTFLAVKTAGASGTFMFVIDETAVPVDYITIDTHSVLIEVSSVGVDYVAAFEVFGAANTVLIRNLDYETLPRHALPMARDEFHVLASDRRPAHGLPGRGGQPPRRGHGHLHPRQVLPGEGPAHRGRPVARAVRRRRPARRFRDHRDRVWDEVARMGPAPAQPGGPAAPGPVTAGSAAGTSSSGSTAAASTRPSSVCATSPPERRPMRRRTPTPCRTPGAVRRLAPSPPSRPPLRAREGDPRPSEPSSDWSR